MPRLFCAAVVLLSLLGCESENRAACEQYRTYYGALPCAAGTDSGIECEAFADHPCALGPYFACLQQNQTCNGDVLESNVGDCAALLNCAAN